MVRFKSPKMKFSLTIKKFGFIDEHKTFKGSTNVSVNLDRKKSNMANGGKLIAKVPLSWKQTISQGVVIPHKLRNCAECEKDSLCEVCDKLVNKIK